MLPKKDIAPEGAARAGRVSADNPWPSGQVVGKSQYLGETVRDRVAQELRERILTGLLRPGVRMDLDELGREFGVSRTPVREAILALSHDGLMEMAPRSGVTVIGVTPQDIEDNFALMAMLSGMAAMWASERATDDDLRSLEELGSSGREAAAGDADFAQQNWLFHRQINRASRSPRLLTMLRGAGRLVPQTFFKVIPEQVDSSAAEHEELLAAIVGRNGEQARTIAETHFANAGHLLAGKLSGPLTPRGSDITPR